MSHQIPCSNDLSHAVQHLIADGVICYPTEAVWGLGCHPQSEQAFERILTMKKRPLDKGVILVASDMSQLMPYGVFNDTLVEALSNLWPGFVTCLLPKSADCPHYLSGQFDTVAVRVSAHPIVRQLCQTANSALVSTSANLSGQAPVTTIDAARKRFGEHVDAYVDAPLGGEAKPSRIIEFVDDDIRVIRD